MTLRAYTGRGRRITNTDENRCNTMWHVFIQWLTSEDLLDQWMTYLVERDEEGAVFTFYHKNLALYTSDLNYRDVRGADCIILDPYDFLNYTLCGPGWDNWTGRGVDADAVHFAWARVRDKVLTCEDWRTKAWLNYHKT